MSLNNSKAYVIVFLGYVLKSRHRDPIDHLVKAVFLRQDGQISFIPINDIKMYGFECKIRGSGGSSNPGSPSGVLNVDRYEELAGVPNPVIEGVGWTKIPRKIFCDSKDLPTLRYFQNRNGFMFWRHLTSPRIQKVRVLGDMQSTVWLKDIHPELGEPDEETESFSKYVMEGEDRNKVVPKWYQTRILRGKGVAKGTYAGYMTLQGNIIVSHQKVSPYMYEIHCEVTTVTASGVVGFA